MADDPKLAATVVDPANNGTSPADGSKEPPVSVARTVPEAEHLNLKRLHETTQADLGKAQSELSSVRALLKGAEDGKAATTAELTTLRAKVSQLEGQVKTFTDSQITTLRTTLKARGVSEDKVKDATLEQLNWLASVLPPAPAGTPLSKNGFDASGAGGGDVSGLSARGKIAHALASQH